MRLKQPIKPLNKFQKSLMYTGFVEKPGTANKFIAKNLEVLETILALIFVAIIIFGIIYSPYLLLVFPATGAVVFYRENIKFLWWKLKVFVFNRNFYEHRRILYKQGGLIHHLENKRPKRYQKAVIWGQSKKIQDTKFQILKKKGELKKKEYIANIHSKL